MGKAPSDQLAQFEIEARTYSKDTGSGRNGGELDFAPAGAFVTPFAETCFSMPLRTLSAPVKTQFGWHLIYPTAERGTADPLQPAAPPEPTSPGPNWTYLGSDAASNVSMFYIDRATISSRAGNKKAWFLTSLTKSEQDNYSGKYYVSTKYLYLFNCAERTMAVAQVLRYSGKFGTGDNVANQYFQPKAADFAEVAPDTIGETWLQLVCARSH